MDDRLLLSPPHVTDLDRIALLRAFDSGWIAPAGPEIDALEDELREVTGVEAVVALSSGTAALQLALRLAGVRTGQPVAIQSFTFIASASAAVNLGAHPVFIDSEPRSWNVSPTLLDEELEMRAREGKEPVAAVVAVDLYGRCADYSALVEVCQRHGVPLIDDAAEALGSSLGGFAAGSFGDFGVLSFNGNKIITTSGGGALLCHSQESARRARYLSTQARQPHAHYEHTEVGYNFRMSNLLAAIGRSQLAQLHDRAARRREIRQLYAEAFAETEEITVFGADVPDDNAWLTCVLFDGADPEAVRLALESENIESRPLWKPMHLQPVFAGSAARIDGTSERLFNLGLCLPSGSTMSDSQVERVANVARNAVRATR